MDVRKAIMKVLNEMRYLVLSEELQKVTDGVVTWSRPISVKWIDPDTEKEKGFYIYIPEDNKVYILSKELRFITELSNSHLTRDQVIINLTYFITKAIYNVIEL